MTTPIDYRPHPLASNRIYVAGSPVRLPDEVVAAGGWCTNHIDDGAVAFKRYRRRRPVQHIVLHESAGGVDGGRTIRRLHKHAMGVHIVVHPSGHLTSHGDLVDDRMVHAHQLNHSSVGIELINPYLGYRAKPPFLDTIPNEWWTWTNKGKSKRYLLPTPAQIAVMLALVPWLTSLLPDCPHEYPTACLDARHPRWFGWAGHQKNARAKPDPGVVAHRDFASHSDGRWILERLIDQMVARSAASTSIVRVGSRQVSDSDKRAMWRELEAQHKGGK